MEEEVIIYETNYWVIKLSADQSYLGRSVVVLKRYCAELSELTPAEWQDLHKNVIKKLEIALKKSFGATMFNWTCLMNNAYKSESPKPQVHWHFRPRYKKMVDFAGEHFEDPEFAHHYSRERKMIVSKKVLQEISDEINKFLRD